MDLTLGQLLQQANQLATQLLSWLEKEKQALAAADWSALSIAHDHKKALLQALEQLNEQHHDVIAHISEFIAQAPQQQQASLQQHHQQLQDTIAQCQHQNEVNELVTKMSHHNNRRILTILQGKEDSLDLYGHNGQPTSQHISNYDIEV